MSSACFGNQDGDGSILGKSQDSHQLLSIKPDNEEVANHNGGNDASLVGVHQLDDCFRISSDVSLHKGHIVGRKKLLRRCASASPRLQIYDYSVLSHLASPPDCGILAGGHGKGNGDLFVAKTNEGLVVAAPRQEA